MRTLSVFLWPLNTQENIIIAIRKETKTHTETLKTTKVSKQTKKMVYGYYNSMVTAGCGGSNWLAILSKKH